MTTDRREPHRRRAGLAGLTGPVVDIVLDSVDPNDVLDRIDVDELLDRVDVNRLLDRVDPDRLLDRVDPDRLLDRVDVDRLMDRVDVAELVQRAGVADIVRESTQDVAGSAVDGVRRYAVGLDVVVTGALRRLLRRDFTRFPTAPETLVPATDGSTSGGRTSMTGRYAGLVTRLLANALDAVLVVASFVALWATGSFVLETVFGVVTDGETGTVWLLGVAAWSIGLLWVSLATTGRTPGGAVLGLRVVRRDGTPLPPLRCLVRVIVLPVSASLFGLGYLGVIVGRERRALHDVAAGSTVVYDWGDEVATMPTPVDRWLTKRAGSDAGDQG